MNWFGKFILCISLMGGLSCQDTAIGQPPRTTARRPSKPKPAVVKLAAENVRPRNGNEMILPKKDSAMPPQEAGEWAVFTNQAGSAAGDQWVLDKPLKRSSADYVFYLLAGLTLIAGIVRVVFPKYFSDLFGLFFRVTFKQKAMRERLLENTLPSMVLNGLFFISGGFFLYFLSGYYHWSIRGNFWYSLGCWVALLVGVYGVKWLLLKTMGWLFQMRESSNTYSFIVFLVNKVLGVMLLPVIILMALGPASLLPALVTIVIFLLAALFIYRYVISYPTIRSNVRVSQFHFFLYLCAFEIVPLLIIYKGLAMRLSM